MIKKTFITVAALVMVMSFTACGDSASDTTSSQSETTSGTSTTSSDTGEPPVWLMNTMARLQGLVGTFRN